MNLLLVEDNDLYRFALKKHLTAFNITEVATYEVSLDAISKGQFDLAIVDLNLDKDKKGQGLELIPILSKKGTFVVVMSGLSEKDVVEKAFDLGCHDYFEKGSEESAIKIILEKYNLSNNSDWEKTFFEKNFITHSELQKSLIKKSFPIISSDTPIFINGEAGSGKTHLAKSLHQFSKRTGPFVEINCANFNENLLESELFGHEKGAFNSDPDKKIGLLEVADQGTVFLDDIAALTPGTQTKLLRTLEDKKFLRLRGTKAIKSDFRIISACLENLQELVDQKKFRKDLFYRLAGISIYLLPLRERPEDVIPLIDYYSGYKKLSFTKDAKEELQSYSWPGNIRELNYLTSYLTKTSSGRISAEEVKTTLSNLGQPKKHKFVTKELMDYAKNHGLQSLLALIEREVTRDSFQENEECMTKVLSDLKISRRQFYRAVGDVSEIEIENNYLN